VSIPLNTVIELTPRTYGCEEKRYLLLSKEEMMKVRRRRHGSVRLAPWTPLTFLVVSRAQDGQDEPVTSMPVKAKQMAQTVRENTERGGSAYTFDVMNPPSF
jgi:hypothetical protein